LFGYLSICYSWLSAYGLFDFLKEERIFSNREVGKFSFVGPCIPYIPCNSQDDFHHRGHIKHHLIFVFGGISLSSVHLFGGWG
jgi:hypothetical protein